MTALVVAFRVLGMNLKGQKMKISDMKPNTVVIDLEEIKPRRTQLSLLQKTFRDKCRELISEDVFTPSECFELGRLESWFETSVESVLVFEGDILEFEINLDGIKQALHEYIKASKKFSPLIDILVLAGDESMITESIKEYRKEEEKTEEYFEKIWKFTQLEDDGKRN